MERLERRRTSAREGVPVGWRGRDLASAIKTRRASGRRSLFQEQERSDSEVGGQYAGRERHEYGTRIMTARATDLGAAGVAHTMPIPAGARRAATGLLLCRERLDRNRAGRRTVGDGGQRRVRRGVTGRLSGMHPVHHFPAARAGRRTKNRQRERQDDPERGEESTKMGVPEYHWILLSYKFPRRTSE